MAVSHTLREVAAFLGVETDAPDVEVRSIGIDSRHLESHALWVARRGQNTHGAEHHAPNAVAAVTDEFGARLLEGRLPVLVVSDPAIVVGRLSDWFFDSPASSLTTWAVTGTNGKTTVTHILEHALSVLGRAPGIIGTLGARAGNQSFPLARTTPEATDVHHLLALMRDAQVTDVAMEVSSHALVLGRVDGLRFDTSVFTNLSQDHLDFHGTMESYFQAKAALFTPERTRKAVINIDDEWGLRLAAQCAVPFLTYGFSDRADVRVQVESSSSGMSVSISHEQREYVGNASLMGSFNAANLAGAYAALVSHGIEPRSAFDAVISALPVPGRMEVVHRSPLVIVDYAHTPEAVEIVLTSLRSSARQLVCVLGCGGDRDSTKRPLMGQIAATLSDAVIVTDDNPRNEDPQLIRAAVLKGTRHGAAIVHEVADRRAAITSAIGQADVNDVVVILGKGAEQGQEVGGQVTAFDDRMVAREALEGKMSS